MKTTFAASVSILKHIILQQAKQDSWDLLQINYTSKPW